MNSSSHSYCIIIPCFNESKRILGDEFLEFINSHPDFQILFVDDGSTDNTFESLSQIAAKSNRIEVLQLQNNVGKAEAIREGVQNILHKNFDYIGFLDADLAIPFSELIRLKNAIGEKFDYVFSSKKQTEGSELEYKLRRHFVGRVLSNMVRWSLKTNFYDTQCGCKLMKREIAEISFNTPFINPWLFDIEILWRIIIEKGRPYLSERVIEIPVLRLIDRGSSRIKPTDLFSLPLDFLKIHFHYKKKISD